ncbi:efflux RND transporter periplasmic adaptor subunit [bacterium]|nr:efflux RND transporter periplasmic adaptor subunit [bacterium]
MKRIISPFYVLVLFMACGNPDTQVTVDVASPVSVQEVTLKPIEEYITTTGTVKATQDVTLKAETSGYYKLAVNPRTKKPFSLGDLVKKDEIIINIENVEQENSIKIDSQVLSLDISKREYEKQQSLYDKGGVTLRELKDSEKSYIDSKYSYDNALIQLSKLKIIAPFDGYITDLPYYTPGVKIDSGTEMVHIMDYRKLNMDVQLPGRFLDQIKNGQPVRVSNYTIPDKVFQGAISEVSPAIDSESRTFKAYININNEVLLLRPGMFVKAEVVVARNDSTIVIPKNIILSRGNRKVVFAVESSTAVERVITTGLENPEEVEVTQGIKSGERIVVEGFETLRNRAKVKIIQ